MSLSVFFYITMFLWLILGVYQGWPGTSADGRSFWPLGNNLLLFLLILILGIHAFGWPIKGS